MASSNKDSLIQYQKTNKLRADLINAFGEEVIF